MAETPSAPKTEIDISWNDVTRFVRQLGHDLRNHLNAAELQAVYLNELTTDAELKTEIKRLRAMISQLGSVLQHLSVALALPKLNPIAYRAGDLIEDIRKKFENDRPTEKSEVTWQIETGDATLDVDPQLMQAAIFELFENAFRHRSGEGPLRVQAQSKGGQFIIVLREPKTEFAPSTEDWGREPLRNLSQGHYGLGLNRVRGVVEAHGGRFKAEYDPSAHELISTIMLPLASART